MSTIPMVGLGAGLLISASMLAISRNRALQTLVLFLTGLALLPADFILCSDVYMALAAI